MMRVWSAYVTFDTPQNGVPHYNDSSGVPFRAGFNTFSRVTWPWWSLVFLIVCLILFLHVFIQKFQGPESIVKGHHGG